MNNDFNFKPKSGQASTPEAADSTATNPEPTFNPATETPATDVASETSQVQPTQVVTSKRSPGKIRRFFGILGLLLLIALVAGAVWYWQQAQIKDLNTKKSGLESQVSTLQAKVAAKDKATTTSTASTTVTTNVSDIITVAPTTIGINDADVSVQYSTKAKEVWVESGTAPDKLTTVSKHTTASMETDGEGFKLTGLSPATRYYYRAAGTVDGKTVTGGVVSFTTKK